MSRPRLILKCKYGLRPAAWYDEKGTAHLDINLEEMQRLEKVLKLKFKRDSTVLELFEHVKEATTQ